MHNALYKSYQVSENYGSQQDTKGAFDNSGKPSIALNAFY